MIQLKPLLDNRFTCPKCFTKKPIVNNIRFESINILGDCRCVKCDFEFYEVLPVGHMVNYSFAIGKLDQLLYRDDKSTAWLAESLLKSHHENCKTEVFIERIIYKKCSDVIILNALDSIFGHVLLKLYNAPNHLDKHYDKGLIIIIPKIFKWLIPKGCAEAWVVDLTLGELVNSYESIQVAVSNEFTRFNKVYLSRAFSHPEINSHDIERLTGVAPFHLSDFYEKKLTITFVLREDRWWFKTQLDYWFYRICRRLKVLSWGGSLLALRQNKLVKQTINLIKVQLPQTDFYVVGLGKSGSFGNDVIDKRHWKVDSGIEKDWCNTYAQSHVVVGVHGSNMLLPTAHAAGCVEVLPEDRYGNMVQDITVRYTNRLQLFFYRFVDQFSKPASVADKAISIIQDYKLYNRSMCKKTYRERPMIAPLIGDDASH